MATKTEILAKLADQHEERIVNVLYDLEDDIINSLQATSGGQKLTTQLAIQLRPNLKRLIEENYLKEADLLVRDYDKVVKNYQSFIKKVPIADRFKTLTKPDLAVINQLKQLSFSGFEDVANRFLTTISDEVYKSAIVGKPFPDMVKAIRGEINGVYQRSNENAIKRLVNIVDKNKYSDSAISKKLTADATRILHTKYASDRVGRNMRLYASQQAHDSIMQFDAQFTKHKAEEAGITSFQYTGTNITTTREFCRARIGNVYTEEEARSIWGGTWKGKSGSDPFIDRGGYRCRHSFIPYDPAWDLEDDVDIKEEKPKEEKKTQSILNNVVISTLLNRGTKKLRKEYDDDFNSQLTEQQKKIVNKFEKPSVIKNHKDGVYFPRRKELRAKVNEMDKSQYDEGKGVKSFVISHEYGHHIDYVTNNLKLQAWSETNDNFTKAILKDKKKYSGSALTKDEYIIDNEEYQKLFDKIATKKIRPIYSQYDKTRKITDLPVTSLNSDGFGEVSDIVDALAKGSFRKKFGMWGHSMDYWRTNGAVQKEIFANLFAVRHNKKAYSLTKTIIPNTVKEFEKRLKELENL